MSTRRRRRARRARSDSVSLSLSLSTPADFVAVLTGVADSWLPTSSGVARARFSLSKSSLAFSITYQR